jgi:hypothetical protein
MKKVLLLGLILAICMLAFPQGVMAATDYANVIANIPDFSEVTATFNAPSGGWILARNADNSLSNAITVTVNSTSPWSLVAADKTNTPKGYMVSTDVSATPMKTAFVFAGTGLGADNTLFSDQPPQDKTTYNWAIGQPVLWSDNAALEYKIVITFTLTSA